MIAPGSTVTIWVAVEDDTDGTHAQWVDDDLASLSASHIAVDAALADRAHARFSAHYI